MTAGCGPISDGGAFCLHGKGQNMDMAGVEERLVALYTQQVIMSGRTLWNHEYLDSPGFAYIYRPVRVESASEANLVSSLKENGKHAPALDLDIPSLWVPSSTPGHSHLYIDVELEWERYLAMLTVLADVGIIEPGYLNASERMGATFLRLPNVRKPKKAKT